MTEKEIEEHRRRREEYYARLREKADTEYAERLERERKAREALRAKQAQQKVEPKKECDFGLLSGPTLSKATRKEKKAHNLIINIYIFLLIAETAFLLWLTGPEWNIFTFEFCQIPLFLGVVISGLKIPKKDM